MKRVPAPIARRDDLTERQAEFVRLVSDGVRRSEAARLAGYACPKTEVARLMAHPGVRAALEQALDQRINGDLLPRSLTLIDEVISDKTAPTSSRLKAAEIVLKHVRRQAPPDAKSDPGALAGATMQQLEDMVARMQRELSTLEAKTIDHSPAPRPGETVLEADASNDLLDRLIDGDGA